MPHPEVGRFGFRSAVRRGKKRRGQVGRGRFAACCQQSQPVHNVAQFPRVARPVMGQQSFPHRLRQYGRFSFPRLSLFPMDEKILEISLNKIHYFLLNEGEAQALTGTQGDRAELADHLRRQFPGASVVLTLGEAGSLYIGKEGTVFQKAYRVPVVDTTAAGDTYTGYFMAEISAGKPVEQALDMAARASAIAVSRPGAAPSIPDRSQVVNWQFSQE